ncbi:hypothetical protein [Winogradskyella ouciana]|uniref:hypothetical protein n=1 Tax=Winogradskyella ouciana TaxID=2608631 RepID=UPI0012BB0313|nr:hypothetical protein [Winogradskyella ouciana]
MRIKTIITSLFKVLAFTLALSVLLPTAVKLSHVFNHHEHEVCENDDADKSTHFHEFDLDCDFYKFKLTSQFYFKLKLEDFKVFEDNYKITNSQYEFVSTFQKLQTALRGPPQLI